jgi:hypothetical protein
MGQNTLADLINDKELTRREASTTIFNHPAMEAVPVAVNLIDAL